MENLAPNPFRGMKVKEGRNITAIPDILESRPWENFSMIPCKFLKQGENVLKPKDFQSYITFQTLRQKAVVNGCATGLGKTVMAYLTYFYYKMKYENTKLIVITTASAVLQYRAEMDKFFECPELRPLCFKNNMAKQMKLWKINSLTPYAKARKFAYDAFSIPYNDMISCNAVFMNYSIFMRDREDIVKAISKIKKNGDRVCIILDEAAHFKNLTSQTFKAVYSVTALCDKIIAATATITNGKLEEVYAVLKGIGVQPWGNKTDFLKKHCITWHIPGTPQYAQVITGYKNVKEFVEACSPYIVSLRRKDVLNQLPSVVSHRQMLEQDKEQLNMIADLYSGKIDLSDCIEGREIEGADILEVTITGYTKMALSDPYILFPESQKRPAKYKSPKTEEIIRILTEETNGEKTIIYTPYRRYMDVLVNTFKKSATLPDCYKNPLCISGEVSSEDREKNKELFNTSDSHNVIIINDAGAEAINLQTAQCMILTTMPMTFGKLVQVVGRYNRIGSKHESLSLFYLLHEDSQDIDEYGIINQQGVLVTSVTKEDYEGMLDLDYLNSISDSDEKISENELKSANIHHLVFKKRQKRKDFYKKYGSK